MWVKGRFGSRQQVGYSVVYTESLKRVKGCSYGELVMWVKGRFPTAGVTIIIIITHNNKCSYNSYGIVYC